MDPGKESGLLLDRLLERGVLSPERHAALTLAVARRDVFRELLDDGTLAPDVWRELLEQFERDHCACPRCGAPVATGSGEALLRCDACLKLFRDEREGPRVLPAPVEQAVAPPREDALLASAVDRRWLTPAEARWAEEQGRRLRADPAAVLAASGLLEEQQIAALCPGAVLAPVELDEPARPCVRVRRRAAPAAARRTTQRMPAAPARRRGWGAYGAATLALLVAAWLLAGPLRPAVVVAGHRWGLCRGLLDDFADPVTGPRMLQHDDLLPKLRDATEQHTVLRGPTDWQWLRAGAVLEATASRRRNLPLDGLGRIRLLALVAAEARPAGLAWTAGQPLGGFRLGLVAPDEASRLAREALDEPRLEDTELELLMLCVTLHPRLLAQREVTRLIGRWRERCRFPDELLVLREALRRRLAGRREAALEPEIEGSGLSGPIERALRGLVRSLGCSPQGGAPLRVRVVRLPRGQLEVEGLRLPAEPIAGRSWLFGLRHELVER